MSDWPERVPLLPSHGGFISSFTGLVGLHQLTSIASAAWPSANLAMFVPTRLAQPVTIYKFTIGAGATAAGNFDVGIYDRFGNRLVSSGSTAKGASTEHVLDVTDTVIGPGLYYLAMSANGTNNYIMLSGTAQKNRMYGCLQMATAFALPDPATYAAYAQTTVPAIVAHFRSY